VTAPRLVTGVLCAAALLGCGGPSAGVIAGSGGESATLDHASVRDTGETSTELVAYGLPSPPAGAARYLRVIRTTRGDSVEFRVIAGGGEPLEQTVYTTGTLPLPDGCMAMQASVPAVRDLMVPGYALIAVVERHYYDDDCIADEKADTSWVTFLDVEKGFRRVLRIQGDVFRVEAINNRGGPTGGETWDNATTTHRQTLFRTDSRGLHVTVRDQVDSSGNVDYRMVWNGDSTKLVRQSE
jgi:hypothetical protein